MPRSFDHPFGKTVQSLARLRERVPAPAPLVLKKVIHRLDAHTRRLIAACPYAVLATAGADGRCDSSPRGGQAGFIQVIDDKHLVLPEVTGNRRADSLANLLDNPHVGLLLLIPGYRETLRINGRALISEDPALLARCARQGKAPALAIGIVIDECYVHCAKAAIRAALWQPEHWPDPATLPSAAQMLRDHTGGSEGDGSVRHMDQVLAESYSKRLD